MLFYNLLKSLDILEQLFQTGLSSVMYWVCNSEPTKSSGGLTRVSFWLWEVCEVLERTESHSR